ncbi:sulfatase-like hydrolase/transferase [Vallitalea okinawensis]|uniref:sulfatase-like hydrolase/transferase n=1 Tax=Vallitalea okinawensis TaxID=2078660 RepID=UPI000CFAF5AA|nr:sulfatase-like hydrolase/transferase [Vallitalea okinawensis]
MKQKQPNILFVFSDQQRWDTLGCYGQQLPISPHLDTLAEDGTLFKHAFTCQPVCGPARACLQTGRYATEVGCYRNGIELPKNSDTIASRLKDAGYQVGYVGKWHLASTVCDPVPEEMRGGYTDYWIASDVLEFTSNGFGGYMWNADNKKVEFKGYRADCTTDYALDFLDGVDKESEEPFFLFLSYIEPHHQNDENRFVGPEGSIEKYKNYELPEDLHGKDGDYKENYEEYLGACASIDSNVGRLVKKLEEKGLHDDTIIIFTSDHGCHFRTRNKEYKRSWHENAIRIPMIINGPGFKGGKVVNELVSLLDLPKTIIDVADAHPTKSMQGESLKKLMRENTTWRDNVFVQISESCVGRSIRTSRWKYAIVDPNKNGSKDSESDTYMEWEMFDLDNDPFEKNNLIECNEFKEVRKELADILIDRMIRAGEKSPKIIQHDKVCYNKKRVEYEKNKDHE